MEDWADEGNVLRKWDTVSAPAGEVEVIFRMMSFSSGVLAVESADARVEDCSAMIVFEMDQIAIERRRKVCKDGNQN